MKAIVALVAVAFALSLCNLIGRRGSNTNDQPSPAPTGEITSASPEAPPPPPGPADARTSNRNNNAVAPEPLEGITRGAPAAPPSSRPGVNHNSAASVPPPPAPRGPISGGVLNGKATRLVQPAYPAIAKAARASGQVRVQVLIDENGNVVSASPVSGHPLLQSSAAAAARASKFSPTLLSGQPVKVSGIIIYNFVAQ